MPTITGVSPQAFGDGRQVTVTGSGFGTSGTVTIGGLAQNVTSWTDTAVVFNAVRGSQSMGPAVLDVITATGTLTLYDGGSFTLSGAFPSKLQAAPTYFNNFESFSNGAAVTTTGLSVLGDASVPVVVSTSRAYSGTRALRCDYQAGAPARFPKIGLSGLAADEVYVSCNLYWERYTTGGTQDIIFKLCRAGSGTVYSGRPQFYETIRPSFTTGSISSIDRGFVTDLNGTTFLNTNNGKAGRDAWHRVEYRYKLSSPGGVDGALQTYVDGVINANNTAATTRSSADLASEKIDWVLTPFDGMDRIEDSAYYVYVDNLYIDNTPVRVELGNAPTYAACTERVICPASAWSTSSITATAYTGSWATGTTVYAYVIGSDNAVAAGPFSCTVGAAPFFAEWVDSFESYAAGASLGGGDPFVTTSRTVVSQDIAYGFGRQSAKMSIRTADGSGFGEWGGIYTLSSPLARGDEIWVRWRQWWPSNFQFTATPAMKFLRLWMSQSSADQINAGYMDLYVNDSAAWGSWVYGTIREFANNNVWAYTNQTTIPRDRWVTYEVYCKLDVNAAMGGSGVLWRFWIDGQLVQERDAASSGTMDSVTNVLRSVYWFTYWNNETPPDNDTYVDDIVIATSASPPTTVDSGGRPCIGVGTAPLFTDNFQSGAFETTQNGMYWTAGGDADVTIQPGRGLDGTNSAQFQFVGGASGLDAGAERRFDLGALYTEVVIEFDLYIPNGLESWGGAAYAHRDDPPSANNKFFRLWPVVYSGPAQSGVGASLFPTTAPGVISNIRSEWVLTGNSSIGQAGQPLTPFITTADLGKWMAVKIYCKTDFGSGTGSMRIYKNNTLVIDNTGVMDNYAGREDVAPYGWRYGYLLGYANSGFDATTYLQMDNVRFYGVGKPVAPAYAPLATWSAAGGLGGNAITGWTSRGRLSYVTTRGPFGGTVVAGETIPAGSTAYGGTWLNNTTIAAPGETIWFRMYVRFGSSFAFNYGTTPGDGWGGLKFIRFEDSYFNNGTGERYTFQLAVSSAASGTRTTSHVKGATDEVGPSPNPNDFFSPTPPDLITRDNWHSIEVSLKVADTASSNGYIRAWIDDVFAGEVTGVDSVSIGHIIKQITIGDYWNGAVPQNNTWYMDEFILTKQTPDLTDREGRPIIGASRRVGDFV